MRSNASVPGLTLSRSAGSATFPGYATDPGAPTRRLWKAGDTSIYFADLTTPDVALTGMRVVRVLVPGLVPNFAAAFPYQGHGVLRTAAVRLGWRDAPVAEEAINIFPMAHA